MMFKFVKIYFILKFFMVQVFTCLLNSFASSFLKDYNWQVNNASQTSQKSDFKKEICKQKLSYKRG